MKDVIKLLLDKQATLEADKEAEKALACEKIDADYAERASKISALLDTAGYVPPVETVEVFADGESCGEVEAAPAEVAETANGNGVASQPEQVIY